MIEPGTMMVAPQQSVAPPLRGRLRRVVRGLLAPIRYARRRPGRAALIVGGSLLTLALLTTVGLVLWFHYHLRAARHEVELGHNMTASRHLRACGSLRPDDKDVLLLGARVARRMGEWDAAESMLDRYWELNGDDEALVFERLLLRAMRGEIEATGLPLAARIEQGGPDARWAREALIFGMINRFWWGQAAWALEQWLVQSPDDTMALLLRGRLQDQRGQTSEAILSFRRVLELDPTHDEARFRLTTLLLQIRQGEEALAHLEYLRGRDEGYRADPVPWAKALALQGRTAEARAALDECLKGQPDNSEALAERGRIAVAEGDDPLAETLLRRVRSVDPGNIPARAQLAEVLGRNGNAAEAAQEAQAVQKLKDDDERIQQLINGRLQTSPNDPGVYHEIAMITLRAGMVREALRWFKRALDADPNHLPTHQVLVVYYQETGNPILAAKHRALAQKLSVQKK